MTGKQGDEFTAAEVEELCYVARWAVRDFRGNTQWEDLLSEAYIGMWRAVNRVKETGACKVSTAAVYGARWGALEFLRSNRCMDRRHTRAGEVKGALPEMLSLDAPIRNTRGVIGDPGQWDEAPLYVRDVLVDGEAGLESLACEREALEERQEAVRKECLPREWEAFRRCVLMGETVAEAAAAVGMTAQEMSKDRLAAIAKARKVWEG